MKKQYIRGGEKCEVALLFDESSTLYFRDSVPKVKCRSGSLFR